MKRARKQRAARAGMEKNFNNNTWTEARMRSFVMSALRRAQWPPKFKVLERAFVERGLNPKTGKPCKLHRCEHCQGLFPKSEMRADHAEPVVPLVHDWQNQIASTFLGYDFNEIMRRLWIEEGEGWNVLCKHCHDLKSEEETSKRTEFRKHHES